MQLKLKFLFKLPVYFIKIRHDVKSPLKSRKARRHAFAGRAARRAQLRRLRPESGAAAPAASGSAAASSRAGHASWNRGSSEEHTSELQSLMRHSYAVFCLKKKTSDDHTSSFQSRTRTS